MSHPSDTKPRRRRRTRRFSPDLFAEALDAGGWTLVSLSEKTGVSASTLSKLSQGLREMPRSDTYLSIIKAMRLKRGDLLEPVPAPDGES
ncbi:helix-turn-helix domain-containing protein [Nocardiopsis dassonvillei]|uniref:helix-turn-helix domain-containing protein n=1 Tax=Nocardiopsis dassonvillei TaxID=2014 RepID=UPI0036FEABF1